jgi:amino acid adenylation domain-containing protein
MAVLEKSIEPFPLSPLQHGMLFRRHFERHPGTDLVQVTGDLRETIDEDAFIRAWRETVARHDSLHCRIDDGHDGQPCQTPMPDFELPVLDLDWSGLKNGEPEAAWKSHLHEDRMRGFDFTQPPLRLAIMRLGPRRLGFCFTFHHIAVDGSGLHIVIDEVFARLRGCPPAGPAPSYRSYIEWHEKQDWKPAEVHWKSFLSGYKTPLAFPAAGMKPPPDPVRYAAGDVTIPLRAGLTGQLWALARASGVTMNTVLQAAWALLLARHNGADDVVFGTTRRCRKSNVAGAEEMPGMFVNTVPMRARIPSGANLGQWLREIRDDWTSLRDFENTPLVLVQGWSEIPKGSRLFGTILNYLQPCWDLELKARGGEWENRDFRMFGQGGDYVTLDIYAGAEELILRMPFDPEWMDEALVRAVLDQFAEILHQFVSHPDSDPRAIRLASEREEARVLAFGDAQQGLASIHESLPALFQKQAAKNPEATALVWKGKPMSYRELDERSNRLARALALDGLGSGRVAGLCHERSAQWIVAMLAILKCGACVLPLDTEYPASRVALLVRDSGAAIILTRSKHLHLLPDDLAVFNLDEKKERTQPKTSPPEVPGGEAPAWLFHTSGSTGLPKGVLVPHRAIARLVLDTNYADFGSDETFLLFAPASFDAVTFEIWGSLLNGGRLVIAPPGLPSLARLGDFIQSEGVTTLWMTTGLFVEMLTHWPDKLAGLRQLLTGGSVVPVAAAARARAILPGVRILNGYGPTENATFTTVHEITAGDTSRTSIPIGKPIHRTIVRVLDDAGSPCPIGVAGEIFCGGDGLALGYDGDPELTARRFIPDRYSGEPGAKLYRTGDAGRWLPDGSLEFVGRRDQQVKIRGFRVEPGEVEAWLCRHPGVLRGVVVVKMDEEGMPFLHAYYEAESDETEDPRSFLRENLPAHLLPATVNRVNTMPLKPNGKIDTAALPEPIRTRKPGFEAAATPLQQVVRGLFARVLGRPSVGMGDDFFESGGHSLKAMQLVASLERAFGREIPVRALFSAPTPGRMAEWLEKDQTQLPAAGGLIVPIVPSGSRPPLFAIPGGQGRDDEMIVFAGLARYLPEGQPVHAFHSGMAQNEGWNDVKDIARRYLDALVEFHGPRPFHLAGECVAGVIAHEMARQCAERGLPLLSLILLDAFCPGALPEPSTEQSSLAGLRPETRQYITAMARFRPDSYHGKVEIIASRESRKLHPSLGWMDPTHGRIGLVEVPGDHETYLREEAQHTGAALSEILS